MKVSVLTVLTAAIFFISGCTTPVAIDPMTGQEQVAKYRGGYFYAPLNDSIGEVFKTAIRELDDMGYFRTGELHKDATITIDARKIGDEKITVRLKQLAEGQSELRIRVGKFGDLAESQSIYGRIRDAL